MFDGEVEDWTVVPADQRADHRHFQTSQDAPLGQALMGHTAGETVRVKLPGGIMRPAQILEVRAPVLAYA